MRFNEKIDMTFWSMWPNHAYIRQDGTYLKTVNEYFVFNRQIIIPSNLGVKFMPSGLQFITNGRVLLFKRESFGVKEPQGIY